MHPDQAWTWPKRPGSRSLPPVGEATIDGRWLRQRRREIDCTQEQLADRLGCTSSMLKKIERGERTPSALLTARIVELLGAPDVLPAVPQLSVSVFVAGDPSNEWMRSRLPKPTGQGLVPRHD
jgi:transcriptional regulator with XRE-family HTH domain